ncbi:MAG: hypothetical protein ABIN97_15465, partial [Ginsengibacter sp.]
MMNSVTKSKEAFNIYYFLLIGFIISFTGCKKSPTSLPPPPPPPPTITSFEVRSQTINSISFNSTKTLRGINNNPIIQLSFSDKVDKNSVSSAISYNNKSQSSSNVAFNVSYQ